jgi:putative ABC transport system substrate-binding protein
VKSFCTASSSLIAILFGLFATVNAQQHPKTARIGYLEDNRPGGSSELLNAFRERMSQLGWTEGENLLIEYRFGDGKGSKQLSQLATELASLKLDVIIVTATTSALAIKKATRTIPVVMASVGDPVRLGIVASLARPGGNITGAASLTPQLSGKRLELLREAVPRATRIGVLKGNTGQGGATQFNEMKIAAVPLGLQLEQLGVANDQAALENSFQIAARERVHGLITTSGPVIFGARKQIVALAQKYRLPGMYPQKEFAEEGGLLFYGVDRRELYRKAAWYVDKILNGAKPGDLPVEQPTKFEFIINLKAAKQIGWTIPPHVLARADRVIK